MVPISPQVYSAEAVVFDTKPLFDYAQKLEERRAKRALAEQEAVENYLKELPKSINPAGMAVNDIPDFLAMQKEFRQLSNKYKSTKNPLDKIAVENKADEMLLHVSKSKDKVKKSEQPTATLADPNKKGKVDFTKLSSALDFHNLPIKDPNRKEITSLSPYFFPEQYDEVSTFNQAAKGVDKSQFPTTIVGKDKIIPIAYGDDAIRLIGENYVKLVSINPEAVSYYTGKLKNLPSDKIAEAVARVKKYYPKLDIDDDSPSLIMLSDAISTAEKVKSQDIQNAPRISVSTGGVSEKAPLDFYSQLLSAWKPYKIATQPYEFEKGRKGLPLNKIENADLQSLLIQKAEKLRPDIKTFSQKNIYLKRFPDYSIHLIHIRGEKDIDLGKISKTDVNIPLQPSSGLRVQAGMEAELPEMTPQKEKEPSYLIKGKTYKQSQLLSMYTQDQINEALKAGTVKIKK